jgi:hypothetical protein
MNYDTRSTRFIFKESRSGINWCRHRRIKPVKLPQSSKLSPNDAKPQPGVLKTCKTYEDDIHKCKTVEGKWSVKTDDFLVPLSAQSPHRQLKRSKSNFCFSLWLDRTKSTQCMMLASVNFQKKFAIARGGRRGNVEAI